jgi:hypothetical protein
LDPEEIARDLTDAILRKPDGDEIAKIDSVELHGSGQTLLFEISDYGAGKKYRWTIDTQRVIDEAGSKPAARDVRWAVMNLYRRAEGDRSVLGGGSPLGSGPPGPGDPELDL